ncbi:metalloregulator ArsR/SmtB family transcription factor [Desulfuromonas sp. AOP6]|uniref:ArsR/SmtB family transcription factor n=1 Tax=Desulfuromonas sp. AOP6 TaxID=1566351 RepID=UPI0012878900|nr:metalloregulator ArsR/SmtB family transcription factor [Desulfuromonas sp. AOP6]BCA79563.1 ArsR family transcriptional regulator [Desulfuromonas sp. AOP6]
MTLSLLKSLADSTRLRLVAILFRGEFTVQELTEILDMGQSRVSRHLKLLLDEKILSVRRQGTWSYYRACKENPLFVEIWPVLDATLAMEAFPREDLGAMAAIYEKRRRKSQDFFNHHASEWDGLSHRLLPTTPYAEQLFDRILPCQNLVEVGVGTGNLLPSLVFLAQTVVGVDQSPAMLAQARQRISLDGPCHIELRLGEMSHLPVLSASADLVLVNMVLHHAANPGKAFKEFARILKDEGKVVIADLLPHQYEWARESLADLWLGFERGDLESWLDEAGLFLADYRTIHGTADRQGVFILEAIKRCTEQITK